MVVDTVVATMEWVDSGVSVAGCKPSDGSAAAPLDAPVAVLTTPLDTVPVLLDAPTAVLPAPVARRPWGTTLGWWPARAPP